MLGENSDRTHAYCGSEFDPLPSTSPLTEMAIIESALQNYLGINLRDIKLTTCFFREKKSQRYCLPLEHRVIVCLLYHLFVDGYLLVSRGYSHLCSLVLKRQCSIPDNKSRSFKCKACFQDSDIFLLWKLHYFFKTKYCNDLIF